MPYAISFNIPPTQRRRANGPVSSFKNKQYQGIPSFFESALFPYYKCAYNACSSLNPVAMFVPYFSQSF